MSDRFRIGHLVQTPFGKGVVREVRNNGRLLVDLHGRALVVHESEVSDVSLPNKRRAPRGLGERDSFVPAAPGSDTPAVEVDLHGLTVADALACAEAAVSAACLSDAAAVRLIHGQSGGRIRAALHRRLREIPSVRGFALDPGNAGITIVRL
jgi:dsDNA-specific endonuclease/ATPase MutS2